MARVGRSRGRSLARRCAAQALYQWQMNHAEPRVILAQLPESEQTRDAVDRERLSVLVVSAIEDHARWQALLQPLLDRPLNQVDPVEQALLLIGVVELAQCPDTPYRVVINEAVELAKLFGGDNSHAFVNSVLDRVARILRPVELKRAAPPAEERPKEP
ncbi:MAG: transcription antitermination factor NusB [Pseudomonadota bacterium]|nr:transcription antitermination factor NusB [Pseudomonadota bacterium]